MKDLLIFPALVVSLLITMLLESKIFVIFLILIIIRILMLKNLKLNLLIMSLMILFFVRCQLILDQNHSYKAPEIQTGIIFPDKIAVNGDVLSGEMATGAQTVKFIYRIKSESEQKKWLNLDEIVQVKPTIKKIERIPGPRNIGEFDFAKFSNHKAVFFNAQIEQMDNVLPYQAQSFKDKINVLRIHIINYLAKLPKWLRIYAQSLLVGYTGYSDKGFLKILSILGIIHLFSLSGLHVLILLTIIRKFTSLLRIPLEWVDLTMLMLLPCYGILVGSKSGIWRAIVLAMIGIIVRELNLSLSRLDIFSLTLMICLFIYPFGITEMGGQLSFLLSFAILYLYRETKFLLMTFKMNLVSLPLICFYTSQLNWLTLLTNLFFVPFFSYIILPITIVSAMTVRWSIWQWINKLFEKLYSFLDFFSYLS